MYEIQNLKDTLKVKEQLLKDSCIENESLKLSKQEAMKLKEKYDNLSAE